LPNEVDDMPLAWSGGWLFNQLALLETDPKKFWDGPVGFDDAGDEWRERVDGLVDLPDGWQNSPVEWREEVNG
jgi:hypothetical protein